MITIITNKIKTSMTLRYLLLLLFTWSITSLSRHSPVTLPSLFSSLSRHCSRHCPVTALVVVALRRCALPAGVSAQTDPEESARESAPCTERLKPGDTACRKTVSDDRTTPRRNFNEVVTRYDCLFAQRSDL